LVIFIARSGHLALIISTPHRDTTVGLEQSRVPRTCSNGIPPRSPPISLFILASSLEHTWLAQTHRMDTLTTHPSTAQQAKAFTSPASLSFPGGAGDLTPPSEKDGNTQANGQANGANGYVNGQQHQGVNAGPLGTGVTPTTPAATPGAGQTGVSGIVPTLQ